MHPIRLPKVSALSSLIRPSKRNFAVLLALVFGWHAVSQALANTALYAGTMADGSMVFMQLEIDEDGVARMSVRSEPRHWVEEGGPHFDVVGSSEWSDGALVTTGSIDAWRGVPVEGAPWWSDSERSEPAPVEVRVWAAAREGAGEGTRELDPFGFAALTITESNPPGDVPNPLQIRLGAIGTMFESRARLLDASLDVVRRAPFFYEPTWAGLDLAASVRDDVGSLLQEGLDQRRAYPDGVAPFWTDERTARVMSFGPSLVSVLYFSYTYTGGAHPNTYRTSATFLRGDTGWSEAGLCDALASIDVPCEEQRMREFIVSELMDREAVWVVEGEVAAATPWLLDTFTIVPWAVRFDYSPYEVGPYVQGPFTVHVPFRELLRR